MKIILNGKPNQDYDVPLSVADLLERLGFTGQPVLVELNESALHPREFPEAMIEEGAQIELIRIAAGG